MENQFGSSFKNDIELYYDSNKKKWVKRAEYTGNYYPADFVCRSYRAAKRHLQKHDEIPVGTRFRLVSKYVGCDDAGVKRYVNDKMFELFSIFKQLLS